MSDAETRLGQTLKTDAPVRDPMFRVGVLARRERAAWRRRLATTAAAALATALVGALGLSMVGEMVGPGPQQAPILAAGAVALAAILAATCAQILGVLAPLRTKAASAFAALAGPLLWR